MKISFKNAFNSFKLSFSSFLKGIYDHKEGTIIGRNIPQFFQLCGFFILFYIFVLALFIIEYVAVAFGNNNPGFKVKPSSNAILKNSLRLLHLPFNNNIVKKYSCSDYKSYDDIVTKIDAYLEPYKKLPSGTIICPDNFDPTVAGNCAMDLKLLNGYQYPPYGYNLGRPCVFIQLSKIIGFIPEPKVDEGIIKVTCSFITSSGTENVKVYPEGFLRNVYPLNNLTQLPPMIAVIVNSLEGGTLRCHVEAKNIQVSSSFGADGIGNIQINVEKNNDTKCR